MQRGLGVIREVFSRRAYHVEHCRLYDNCTDRCGIVAFFTILPSCGINKLRVVNATFSRLLPPPP
jgi:hypothetical protein